MAGAGQGKMGRLEEVEEEKTLGSLRGRLEEEEAKTLGSMRGRLGEEEAKTLGSMRGRLKEEVEVKMIQSQVPRKREGLHRRRGWRGGGK